MTDDLSTGWKVLDTALDGEVAALLRYLGRRADWKAAD
jgi:hypothetical protein